MEYDSKKCLIRLRRLWILQMNNINENAEDDLSIGKEDNSLDELSKVTFRFEEAEKWVREDIKNGVAK